MGTSMEYGGMEQIEEHNARAAKIRIEQDGRVPDDIREYVHKNPTSMMAAVVRDYDEKNAARGASKETGI